MNWSGAASGKLNGVGLVLLRLLTAMAVLTIGSFWPAGKPAIAAASCTCLVRSGSDAVSTADVVFIGTLNSAVVSPVQGTNGPATYTFAVETVFKGTAPVAATVFSFADPDTCGLVEMQPGARYLIFADLVRSDTSHPTGAPEKSMMSTTCSGSIKLDPGAGPPDYLGKAVPPITAAPGATLPQVALDLPSPPDTTWKRSLAIVAGAIVVLGLLARLLAGRRNQIVQ